MADYKKMSKDELMSEFSCVKEEFENLLKLNLSLDMSRGKPGFSNADLSNDMLVSVNEESGYKNREGIDCRNYGGVDGIIEIKELFADILGVKPSEVIVGGNSSLTLMFDIMSQGITHGFGCGPIFNCEKRKFLCPVPGYDRHFALTDYFGYELIPVEMDENGPDMEKIEELVKDETVKGIWCVPKYSNPDGITYSDQTVRRFAALKPAAKDFHIFWDNAYAVHDLTDNGDKLLNIFEECKKNGNEDLPFIFASTSKISLPGDGVSVVAASEKNLEMIRSRLKLQTVGPDKVNMLRHARKFPDIAALKKQMAEHAKLIKPKFDIVLSAFEEQLKDKNIARWTKPNGGYFISLYLDNGCAKRVHALCKEAGLVLTNAGAAYPYGKDLKDTHLRIAPTYPTTENLKTAVKVLCIAVRYAALEKLLG